MLTDACATGNLALVPFDLVPATGQIFLTSDSIAAQREGDV
jgi:hypothetical protein